MSQWEGMPDAAFMVLVLDAHAMTGASGVARYRDGFNAVAWPAVDLDVDR